MPKQGCLGKDITQRSECVFRFLWPFKWPLLDPLLAPFEQTGKGSSNLGVVVNESPIEVHKPQEDLDIVVGFGLWPLLNSGHTPTIHRHPIGRHYESQEFDFSSEEIAFLQTRVETKTTEVGKHLLVVIQVLFLRVRIYQDIVQIHDIESIHKPRQRLVDGHLKSCWGIGESERHDQVFKVAISGAKCSLPLVALSNPNAMISLFEIQLGEYLGTSQAIQSLTDQWKGVVVLHHYLIQPLIVDAQSEATILLWNEKD